MFNRRSFGDMRRAGMSVGVSRSKLAAAMLEILLELPMGTKKLKETVVAHMGLIGQMSATRDINEAWNTAKKKAVKEAPEKFLLNQRGVLLWNDGSTTVLDRNISSANFKRLNELATAENCTVNQLVSKLIKAYQKEKP